MKKLLFLFTLIVVFPFLSKAQCWTDIAVGKTHSVALKSDGTLWTWGSNDDYQLGNGAKDNKAAPIQIGSDTDWMSVFAGDTHSFAIKKDGSTWSWGGSYTGHLALSGNPSSVEKPTKCDESLSSVKAIQAGYAHSVAIKSDGTILVWGSSGRGQFGNSKEGQTGALPSQVGETAEWVTVSAGTSHNIALKKDGSLWAWGDNTNGQLGDGSTTQRNVPTQITKGKDWAFIDAGANHNLTVKKDGTLWSWGSNMNGQLGDKSTDARSKPSKIGKDNDWVWVEAGFDTSFGMKKDGSIWSWGVNYAGHLGNGLLENVNAPTKIIAAKDWKKVVSREGHGLAIDKNNQIWSWGDNSSGQLGNAAGGEKSPTPIQVSCK